MGNKFKIYLFFIFLFIFFYTERKEEYNLKKIIEIKEGCYSFNSDEDLKNIARIVIINKFGENSLNKQRKLVFGSSDLYDELGLITLIGVPHGVIYNFIEFLMLRKMQDIPIIVRLIKDKKDKCVYVKDVVYKYKP